MNDDTFDAALALKQDVWFEVPKEGMTEVEAFFKKRFITDGKSFEGLNFYADLGDKGNLYAWIKFKDEMDAAFAHGGKSIFVHLDKDNGKIWFDENDMTVEEKAALETE